MIGGIHGACFRHSGSPVSFVGPVPPRPPLGEVQATPEPATEVRPFGLRPAVPPRVISSLDIDSLGYDDEAQVGLVRCDGAGMVPLARHTDGQTNTQTDADGHQGNDSDTDHRED
ncbi:putative ATP-grasp-modified RiPP [Amycolatopsis pigmentata]|uniref:ATP-grasp-modified RiPP n=1 Tax=Amycolatopsis pigmentata TaxID=450801 RepID=A0ABW5G089_9PSEU